MKSQKSKLDELTAKQRAFVVWFTTAGETFFNGTQSARSAGYKGTDSVLGAVANENLRKPKIAAAVREQTKILFSASDISAERILSDIEMVRILAVKEGKYHTALKASELHGKYLKMFADRVEHVHSIEDTSTQDLVELANQLAEKVDGINFNQPARGNEARTGADDGSKGNPTTH